MTLYVDRKAKLSENMPVCVPCGSKIFDSLDGLYYCRECGTQSQDIRDEDVDGVYEARDGHLQVSVKRKTAGRRKFFPDKGKPWFMYEAYQCIIKAQVEFLIGIGVNPALKDVVFKLWYKYLQVTGSAFTGTCDDKVPSKSSCFYLRDAELLGQNKRKKRQKKTEDDDEELELCSHFSEEEFYEGDDPFNALPKDIGDVADSINLGDHLEASPDTRTNIPNEVSSKDDSCDSEDEFVGSIALKSVSTKKTYVLRKQVRRGHATFKLTLAFCYLGLLWINEPVFLSDLIRWAKQGHLPYFQAARHLPGYMKFGSSDYQYLCPKTVPFPQLVIQAVSQIARLTRLPRFPEQRLSTYTSRFITDLRLPGFLHGIVRRLMEKVKIKGVIHPAMYRAGGWCIPNFEAAAMAFIVVALKLCYGIDDSIERKQEATAAPRGSSSNNTSPEMIPLFTDWLKSWKHCEAKKMENDIPWTNEQFKLLRNPTGYTSFSKSDILGSWQPSDKVYTAIEYKNLRGSRTTNEESQQRYTQLFKSLMSREREKEFNESATPRLTSFPGSCSHEGGEGNCFDGLRSRGLNTEILFENGNDDKYISYTVSGQNKQAFHNSYQMLLNILADRIEAKASDIQVKVHKLESALFFNQSLPLGFL